MDRTVPAGAAHLLDFIRRTEVGRDDRASYDIIYGHNQDKLPTPITSMTVDEVIAAQAGFTRRFGSSATGAYQFMKATLADLKRELGLRGGQILDPDLQDRLGYHLLKRRGYDAFMAGQINRTEFGKRLAQEWASFPVLAGVKGQHRTLKRGQSYYAGDGMNKALVPPEKLEAVIDQAKALGDAVTIPMPLPRPEPIDEPVAEVLPPEVLACPACGSPVGQAIVARTTAVAGVGHNGGPAMPAPSPVEQVSKVKGAAVGITQGTGVAGVIVAAIFAYDLLPAGMNTPEAGAVIGMVVTYVLSLIQGAIKTYRAPANAEIVR